MLKSFSNTFQFRLLLHLVSLCKPHSLHPDPCVQHRNVSIHQMS